MGGSGSHGLSMWHWAEDSASRNRLVKVAVVRLFAEDDVGLGDGTKVQTGTVARVFGHDGRSYVVLEEKLGAATWSWTPKGSGGEGFVAFEDGTRWDLKRGGCGCGHPLKRFHPTRTKVKADR